MFSPHLFDTLVTTHHAELLRQAHNERLAAQVSRRPAHLRRRLAEALLSLAARLDPCAVPNRSPASRPA